MKQQGQRIKLLGLLWLSWGLLVWQLGSRSLWVDEYLTLGMIQGRLPDVMAAAGGDIHPPLYFILLHSWVGLVGSGDFALRLLSAMSGLLGVALLVPVARLLAGRRLVVPAGLLLVLSPPFVEFGRMARYYVPVLALGLLSTYLLLRALRRGRWPEWAGYVAASLAMVYTFYPAVGLVLAQGWLVLAYARSKIWPGLVRWSGAVLLVGLGFLPWLLPVARGQVLKVAGGPGADFSRSLVGFGLGLAASFYTFSLGETIFPWRPAAWLGLLLILLLLGLSLLRRANRLSWPLFGLVGAVIIFVGLVTTFINPGTPFLNVPVRALFALPYYLLGLAIGLVSLGRPWRLLAGGLLLGVWAISIGHNFTGQQFLNPIYLTPAKEAAAFVSRQVEPGHLVISDEDSVFGHYFLAGPVPARHLYTRQVAEIEAALSTERPGQVWLVALGRDQTRRSSHAGQVRSLLGDSYQLEQVQPYLPIDPVYGRVKNRLLGRASYEYRLTVEQYTAR